MAAGLSLVQRGGEGFSGLLSVIPSVGLLSQSSCEFQPLSPRSDLSLLLPAQTPLSPAIQALTLWTVQASARVREPGGSRGKLP